MRWPLVKPMQASAARTDPVVSMGCWQLAIGLSVVGGRASKVSNNPDVLCTLPPVGASPLPMPAHRLPTPRFPLPAAQERRLSRMAHHRRNVDAVTGRARCAATASWQEVTGKPAQPSTGKTAARRDDLLLDFCCPQRYQAPWNSRNNVRIMSLTWVELWECELQTSCMPFAPVRPADRAESGIRRPGRVVCLGRARRGRRWPRCVVTWFVTSRPTDDSAVVDA